MSKITPSKEQQAKEGDFVILITDRMTFITEGRLEVYCPDGEPLAVVGGKTYDLTNEGEVLYVIKKHS